MGMGDQRPTNARLLLMRHCRVSATGCAVMESVHSPFHGPTRLALLKSYFLDIFLARMAIMQVEDWEFEKLSVSIDNYSTLLHTQRVSCT
jgi:hypothetical protein